MADKSISFEPEDATQDTNAIKKIADMATTRTELRTGLVTEAVVDFKTGATAHINDHLRGLTGDKEINCGPLVDGLVSTISWALFPEENLAKIAFETAASLLSDGLTEAISSKATGENAVARLHAAVDALAHEISVREGRAIAALKTQIPDIVADALSQYDSPSTDDAWAMQMCDWIGFTQPTREAIYDPIRQRLEYDFVGVLAEVQAELTQEHSYTSAQESGSPQQWSTEARLEEQRLYNQEGEQAWDDAYKMSDE
jgi:hypothetical protein